MIDLPTLLEELKRRRVVRATVVYTVAAVGAVQTADVVLPRLGLPDWIVSAIVVAALLGIPIVAVISWIYDIGPEGLTATEPAAPGRPDARRVRARAGVAAAGGLVLVVIAAGWMAFGRRGEPLVDDRIVILPFENATGDPARDPIGRLAGEVLNYGLASTQAFDVVPQAGVALLTQAAAVAAPARESDPTREIARRTSARYVLTGAYYREGEKIRVQAELVDASRGRVVRTLEPVLADPNAPGPALTELAREATAALAPRVRRIADEIMSDVLAPPSYEAYQKFAAGMDAYLRVDLSTAVREADAALALDSTYLDAALLAAHVHVELGQRDEAEALLARIDEAPGALSPLQEGMRQVLDARLRNDPRGAYDAAKRLADLIPSEVLIFQNATIAYVMHRPHEAAALLRELDPTSPALRDYLPYWTTRLPAEHMSGDFEAELSAARLAEGQHPDLFGALEAEVRALAALGRTGEIADVIERGGRFLTDGGDQPTTLMRTAFVELSVHGEDAAAARTFLDRAFAFYESRADGTPLSQSQRFGRARTHLLAGELDEAQRQFAELVRDDPEDPRYRGFLGMTAAANGDHDTAIAADSVFLTRLEASENDDFDDLLWRARIAAEMGEAGRAADMFRRLAEVGGWDR